MSGGQARALITPSIKSFVSRSLGPGSRLTEIAGDASTRKFYRISAEKKSAVLMVHLDPLLPTSPLFSNHRVLESIGAPVPRMLDTDPVRGLVLVEDFGDHTLQSHLLAARGSARDREAALLYRRACDLIVLLHRKGAAALKPDDFAATCALDRDQFLFELDHFHRHFILGHRRLTPEPGDDAILRAFYVELAGACDRLPRVYCHRDFQSRNLMVRRGALRLIDFQDARMGPYTYDAASLLRDSSLDLDERLVGAMIARLCRRLGHDIDEFRHDFDLMALQRNIKDLGTFGFMAIVRGRPEYLEYVPRTLRYIRQTLIRSRRYHVFFPVLERYVLDR